MAKKITDVLAWVRTHRKGRGKKEGLRMTQVRILYCLAKHPDGMTRAGIAKEAGVGEQVLVVSIGPLDPSCRENSDERMGYPGLLSLGMVQPDIKVLDEKLGEQLVYVLTKDGEKEYKKWVAKYGDKPLPAPRPGNKNAKGQPKKGAEKAATPTNGEKGKKKPTPAKVAPPNDEEKVATPAVKTTEVGF